MNPRMSAKNRQIEVLDTAVKVMRIEKADFISLTDIARHRDAKRGDYIIQNWMRNRNTIEFLGIWEQYSTGRTVKVIPRQWEKIGVSCFVGREA